MVRVTAFFKNISILITALILLISYAFLDEKTGVLFDNEGNSLLSVSRNLYFYACFFTGILTNLLFHFFRVHYLKAPGISKVTDPTNHAQQILSSWWNSLILSVNLFFGILLAFTALANNAEDYKFSSISSLPAIGILPMVTSLLMFPVIYYKYLRTPKKPVL